MTNDWIETALGRWASERPASTTAEVISLDLFRAKSGRWRMVLEPRGESVEVALRTLDRVLGLAPSPPVVQFPESARRRA